MTEVVTYAQLNQRRCSTPGCTANHSLLYLHAQCHPEAALLSYYIKAEHQLVILCASCEREIIRIDIAPGLSEVRL
jgi:hypothetical protein